MASLSINIICARIATEKSDALDVFYVTDKEGNRLSEEAMLTLRNALMDQLSAAKTGTSNQTRTTGAN
jgi:UTP:GlnB (protein PII) uridylyltransferase